MKENKYNGILLTLYGAIVGIVLSILYEKITKSISPVDVKWLLLLLFISNIVVSVYIVKHISIVQHSIKHISGLYTSDGLKVIEDVDDGSYFAAQRMKNVSIVRVLGMARQDVALRLKKSAAVDYLKSVEARFKLKDPLIFKRITTSCPNEIFASHLQTLFDLAEKNNHSFELAFIDNIFVTISYQVFDNYGVLVVINNVELGDITDNDIMLWSTNKKVVSSFICHFDDVWSRLNVINNKQDFINRCYG